MQYLLDTNICIFYLRGKLNQNEIIKQKGRENCFISEITVFELYFGAENSSNPSAANKAVDNFVENITILPIFGCLKKYA